jgi:glycosyltransferase involved in cell wall biosynthesis
MAGGLINIGLPAGDIKVPKHMKILFTQETDWLVKFPIIQHHVLEMMTLRGHEVRVIDFELLWRKTPHGLFSRRQVTPNVMRVFPNSRVMLIRPGIIKIPVLDYVSVLWNHRREIDRQMREWSPDVIIGVSILNSYWAGRAAQRAGIPFIYYWFELMHLFIPLKLFSALGKMVEKAALRRSDKVLTITDNLKQWIAKTGFPEDKIEVLESGVSLKAYQSGTGRDSIRQVNNFQKEDLVLFFMGWLYHFSGLKEVMREMSRRHDPQIKLLIVGDGDAFEDLRSLQSSLKLSDSVKLVGRKPFSEIPDYLAAADICIFPAYNNETTRDIVPAKLYEYLAASRPVIATSLPAVVSKFGKGHGVAYVEKPEEVIDKAKELLVSPEWTSIGIEAREFAGRYSWENITDRFEAIVDRTIKEKSAGRPAAA